MNILALIDTNTVFDSLALHFTEDGDYPEPQALFAQDIPADVATVTYTMTVTKRADVAEVITDMPCTVGLIMTKMQAGVLHKSAIYSPSFLLTEVVTERGDKYELKKAPSLKPKAITPPFREGFIVEIPTTANNIDSNTFGLSPGIQVLVHDYGVTMCNDCLDTSPWVALSLERMIPDVGFCEVSGLIGFEHARKIVYNAWADMVNGPDPYRVFNDIITPNDMTPCAGSIVEIIPDG